MDMTTAFTIFAKKTPEHAIPFEVSYNPFFSKPNMSGVAELNAGHATEYELIERDYFSGIDKPEPLKDDLSGFWSRRIDESNRLIYRVKNNVIEYCPAADVITKPINAGLFPGWH